MPPAPLVPPVADPPVAPPPLPDAPLTPPLPAPPLPLLAPPLPLLAPAPAEPGAPAPAEPGAPPLPVTEPPEPGEPPAAVVPAPPGAPPPGEPAVEQEALNAASTAIVSVPRGRKPVIELTSFTGKCHAGTSSAQKSRCAGRLLRKWGIAPHTRRSEVQIAPAQLLAGYRPSQTSSLEESAGGGRVSRTSGRISLRAT